MFTLSAQILKHRSAIAEKFFTVYGELVVGSRVVSVLDLGAEGPGSNRSRDAVG